MPYFSPVATQEILDEFRPKMCPIMESTFYDVIKMLRLFLPVNLPPDLHNQGFKYIRVSFSLLSCILFQIMVIGVFWYLGKSLQPSNMGTGKFISQLYRRLFII
jgi:hypothetical protein